MSDLECLVEESTNLRGNFLEELHEELLNETGVSRNLSDADIKALITMLPKMHDNEEVGWEFSQIDPFYQLKSSCGCSQIDFEKLDMLDLDPYCTSESRVLVIYTGGTIGMKMKDGGYQPESNHLCRALRKLPMFHDQRVKSDLFTKYNNLFVMPRSPQNRRVVYVVFEYDPLVDSCDITMDDYIHLALDISNHYDHYDGFVILHGTDTLAYSASSLSFLLENLTKPVILTGSLIPVYELRSDGRENFLTSLMLAGHYQIPEVSVFFHEKLFRGNRISKISSSHFEAFESPNFPPLAKLGVDIKLNKELLLKDSDPAKPLTVSTSLCNNVSILRIFPSITTETVAAFLSPPIEGVVLQTYGSGNVSLFRKDILQQFKSATERGIIIVNISQCVRGGIKPVYKCGTILLEYGVLPGMDMTPEAALVKLSYVLGKSDWTFQQKREAMTTSLRGELSLPDNSINISKGRRSSVDKVTDRLKFVTTAMCIAAQVGDKQMLNILGTKYLCWESEDNDGRNPLQIAVSANRSEIVQALLPNCTVYKDGNGNKGSINSVDSTGKSVLLCAILLKCEIGIIENLLEYGAELNPTGAKDFTNKVFHCIIMNEMDVIKRFYVAKFHFEIKDKNGNSPLHVSAEFNHEELLRFFIEIVQLDIDAKNDNGKTPQELISDENLTIHFDRQRMINQSNVTGHKDSAIKLNSDLYDNSRGHYVRINGLLIDANNTNDSIPEKFLSVNKIL